MDFQEKLNRLNFLLSHIVTQTEGSSGTGLLDNHKILEGLVCEMLKISHGFEALKNLNSVEQENYPAIDLGVNRYRYS